ncbi:MAG: hypothetical protein AAFZ02_05160 [Pseudomonadota bacterium]
MPRVLILAAALGGLAAPAVAELDASQQAAFDVILPEIESALSEQGGEGMAAMAPILATCVVTEARAREVRELGTGDFAEEDTTLMNDIMARPDVQSCLIKAAGQG